MHAIDEKSASVIRRLVGMMTDGYLKLDRAAGSFMPLVVEKVMDQPGFIEVYSLAHYGEQNGDLMADPEMTFGEVDGRFYPLSFRNDYLGYYREVISYRENRSSAVDEAQQKELVEFAATWFRNIKIQQQLT